MTGLLAGSTAIDLDSRLALLSTSPTPVIVPPVPTPPTKMSTLPSVSRQISSAVVLRWIFGIGRVLELLRHEVVVGLFGDQFFGLAHGARHAFGGRRQHQLGAEAP
jgi:hypothetical protein